MCWALLLCTASALNLDPVPLRSQQASPTPGAWHLAAHTHLEVLGACVSDSCHSRPLAARPLPHLPGMLLPGTLLRPLDISGWS